MRERRPRNEIAGFVPDVQIYPEPDCPKVTISVVATWLDSEGFPPAICVGPRTDEAKKLGLPEEAAGFILTPTQAEEMAQVLRHAAAKARQFEAEASLRNGGAS